MSKLQNILFSKVKFWLSKKLVKNASILELVNFDIVLQNELTIHEKS